jgi:hypothetical protein
MVSATSARTSRRFPRFKALLFLATAPLLAFAQTKAAPTAASAGKPIWAGESERFTVTWTSGDIVVRNTTHPAEKVFAASDLARAGFAAYKREAYEEENGRKTVRDCNYSRSFKVLSLVGTFMSIEDSYDSYCDGMPHPDDGQRFTAINLTDMGDVKYKDFSADPKDPGKISLLTDGFAAADVYAALMADPLVRKAIPPAKSAPTEVDGLIRFFAGKQITVKDCDYEFAEDWITRYAIHHSEGGKVAVRLSLRPSAPPCQNVPVQLGLLLSTTDQDFKQWLAEAEAGKKGFVMKDGAKLSAGKTTDFEFKTGKGVGK